MSDYGSILALLVFIAASVWLGAMAQRSVEKGSFLKSYFLGGRGLGAWALALTATVQSGGTFMGFPSLVYSYGWVVALWIASYMVVPITGFGVLAKRLSQLSRRCGAITVPDLYRERFNSPAVGLVSSLLILLFVSFMMSAQFKAGASLMKVAWAETQHARAARLAKESGTPLQHASGEGPSVALSEDGGDGKSSANAAPAPAKVDTLYLTGLFLFGLTVVGYTMIGGFLAAVWTDLFQSVMMFIGVLVLLMLTLGRVDGLEAASRAAVENAGVGFVSGPGGTADGRQFLTPLMALSYFVVWIFGGMGQPASQVRLMACKDSGTIRRSMVLLSVYNLFIYLPLIVVCVVARSIMPDLEQPDEVVPRMTMWLTRDLPGGSLVAGLILAAPFGAVMATVSSFLVIVASGLVRDVYQRIFRPDATEADIKRMTYIAMAVVGTLCVLANIQPVRYLQVIIVFCSSGVAAAFFAPVLMVAFWRRATAAGMIASMLAGSLTVLVLLVVGINSPDDGLGPQTAFQSYHWMGLESAVWGVLFSAIAGVGVSLVTEPPPAELVSKLFDAGKSA
jgi:SSS family solute:Na+ symporter/sodium/pantothenate symporter